MWKRDLKRNNCERSGIPGILIGLLVSPGFCVVTRARIAQLFYHHRFRRVFRPLSLLIWRSTVTTYGCYIARTAVLGEGLSLPHPIGIVIGEGAIIGKDVTVYQNVTLGRSSNTVSAYPSIGDNATLYSGATILGDVIVGEWAVVGANSTVLSDVPPRATVVGSPARIIAVADAQTSPITSSDGSRSVVGTERNARSS